MRPENWNIYSDRLALSVLEPRMHSVARDVRGQFLRNTTSSTVIASLGEGIKLLLLLPASPYTGRASTTRIACSYDITTAHSPRRPIGLQILMSAHVEVPQRGESRQGRAGDLRWRRELPI